MENYFQSVVIEQVHPVIDAGRYPIKREEGDTVTVSADIYKDGHDVIVAFLRYRKKGAKSWTDLPMEHLSSDRWQASFTVTEVGRYEYTIMAYPDAFLSWRSDLEKKQAAGMNVVSEILEGQRMLKDAGKQAPAKDREVFDKLVAALQVSADPRVALAIFNAPELTELMDRWGDKSLATHFEPILEVKVDRVRARFAAWYEFFPRSQGKVPGECSTFKECEERLPDVKAMGFDVVYFPPIHPIGMTNRKGPNNTLTAGPNDPGSPYAIGSHEGGHKAVEPKLGTLDDFDALVQKCHEMGMEVALDFAINCSPDHPYVKEHPDWFFKRPDGTIKYAENPPKKYQDIYPLNFHCANREELWQEMKSVIEFWIQHGVRIFRVDNPHTKPVTFWEWMIGEIQNDYPDVQFLAEAFTHPKMMRVLAKAGFTQSYTYFTWRNFKWDLTEYMQELTQGPMREYFRGNLFANTPDILPTILQEGGRPAFEMRFVLAATLSSVYGIYSGFELCENAALPGKEEYLDSEKYECKVRDWNRPGNIKPLISTLNRIRKENPALHEYDNLEFYKSDNENILVYGKCSADKQNIIIVAVNLDPFQGHHSYVYIPVESFGIPLNETFQVHDLLNDERHLWKGEKNYVSLEPGKQAANVFRVRRWLKRENDFDYVSM